VPDFNLHEFACGGFRHLNFHAAHRDDDHKRPVFQSAAGVCSSSCNLQLSHAPWRSCREKTIHDFYNCSGKQALNEVFTI
jgi:hypothetical protein